MPRYRGSFSLSCLLLCATSASSSPVPMFILYASCRTHGWWGLTYHGSHGRAGVGQTLRSARVATWCCPLVRLHCACRRDHILDPEYAEQISWGCGANQATIDFVGGSFMIAWYSSMRDWQHGMKWRWELGAWFNCCGSGGLSWRGRRKGRSGITEENQLNNAK